VDARIWRRSRSRGLGSLNSTALRLGLGFQMPSCTHLDRVLISHLPGSVEGCEDCLGRGEPWLPLRICLECGKVGCCDDSPIAMPRTHAHSSGHPLIRSLEPNAALGLPHGSLCCLNMRHAPQPSRRRPLTSTATPSPSRGLVALA
jgi:hypothetical protein